MHQEFAQTLHTAYLEKDEKDFSVFFENFIVSLREKGMIKILPKVLKEIENLDSKNKGDLKTIITLKDKSIFDDIKSEIEKYSDTFNLEDIEVKEDKSIVGGFVLKDKKSMVDRSYKTALVNLYTRLVK